MALKLNHFDTKTKQDILSEQKLTNSLAEYLFPNTKFSIGIAYPDATITEDLDEYNGMTLQFSSGHRMFFADNPNIRDLLYPNPSDAAAYPLPFTPCLAFHELKNVRILVIDDVTGENGGVIAVDDARKLVGDCKGLIDGNFAVSNNITSRAFQFRLGIKPQAESPVMRIAKGTLAPAQLDKLGESFFRMGGSVRDATLRFKFGYDMVLATSSFKGRKGEDAIKPGEYILSIGLGVKSLALYREHSLGTQVLINYSQAVKQEILPKIKQQAEKLALDQKHPIKLAQRYIKTYERRKSILAKKQEVEPQIQEDIEQFSIFDNLDSGGESEDTQDNDRFATQQKDLLLYSLLKADLSGFKQIIEHPKIIAELQEFARKEWVEIATGRSIKFTSGLAQPSLQLNKDEISIPFLNEGEEVIVTRSPLINSNGVITLKNKHLPEMVDGCVYIHPQTAMENMQCDFDGDLLAFASSREFPALAAEVKEKNLQENRYPDIVKKAKVPYQGTFQEIAVSAMENKIGIIANEIQKNIALQCEIIALPKSDKFNYLQTVSAHCCSIVKRYKQGKLQIPDKILQQIYPIASLINKNIDNSQIEQNLQLLKKLLKDCVAELGNELQVAADGPKSALRPDDSIIRYCQAITSYKEVQWLADKKNKEVFTLRVMKTNGYSPIDLMIQQTNDIFEQNQLVARPIEQFRKLYYGVDFYDKQRQQAQQIKGEYNSQVRKRIELEDRQKIEHGPYLVITSPTTAKQLEVTNLIKFPAAKNIDFWKSSELTIKIGERNPTEKIPHTLFAQAKFITSDGQEVDIAIGTISMKSIKEHDLKPGMSIKQGKVEFHFGISDGMIDALKQQTREYVESIKQETPSAERLQLAAAIHDISHTESSQNYSGIKRAGVAFAIFSDEVIGQLQHLQFTQMRVIGTQFNEYALQNFQGERLPIKFEDSVHPRDPTRTSSWVIVEGKKLGTLDARSPHLLAGCEAIAAITSAPSTSFIVTSLKNPDHKLQIDSVNQYAFATHQWLGEQVNITLDVRQTQERKAPTVFAYIGNQILGVVNKQSVNFLQGRLAAVNRQLQGFSFVGMLNNAPASYADIVIDSSSVKFPEIPVGEHENNSAVATVVFFSASIDSQLQAKTEQVLCNMLKRAVDRAVERGYDTVSFVDVSLHSDKSSQNLKTIEMLATERKNIKVEFKGTASLEDAIALLTQPDDIVVGIRSPKTIGIIDFASSHRKAIAAYIPETGKFERRNLPSIQPNMVAANNDIERDGSY
ncbi:MULTISPECIES: hypothetical protein [unclassified Tolypothrix]|uniref:hypothetical protein n=1 Tax=unclassified Tolypothrix TaxID=2649714 RepID=UPI0005EAC634|nr:MULTISPECIES: hypothetical protein [unclassified Tolypothrix]BAY93663.1 hypothetical protein NIES3275_57050 [Microchaete diplosiphon NIES-3275]EKE99535.1 hypothetical protein FDUTEX481_09795 [Tolypothrix sp. PCC 7601]MBE9081716.1 hypothetical protein [Tolypothrix sp. LEGE 11397]UYD27483.1 hypothetical protein HGR01_05180 [Tolypothrix sp. PCC 7712]UYD36653.1 hypothetical protein HG267_13530 [Tolypothrix sp. PCC 7601]